MALTVGVVLASLAILVTVLVVVVALANCLQISNSLTCWPG